MDMAKEHSGMGLTFRSDAISWADCVLVTVTDASFAQETIIEPSGREKPQRSQKAYNDPVCAPRHPEAEHRRMPYLRMEEHYG